MLYFKTKCGDNLKELSYPFDVEYLIKNKKKIRKELINKPGLIEKNIAILGGSTTSEIKNMLDIFLLNHGIKANFYESEYNQYFEDAMFGNPELDNFNPDIIYIHTSNVNIINYPSITDDEKEINNLLNSTYERFEKIWDNLFAKFNSVIIQNNFEYPYYRLMGNKEASDIHGRINFINHLNQKFYDYANKHSNFFINDINYISACYGLDKWANQFYYHMYKYAMEVPAIPFLASNLANIIKSIYGKNKKAFVLDLDNTLWGGIVGDDGVNNLKIGPEVSSGQVFLEFQNYIKEHKKLGVILNVDSKNDYENAIAGLNHPAGSLKPDDFIIIKANWEPKNLNVKAISEELNIGADSFVFVDDNPAERKIVSNYIEGIATPEIDVPENYIRIIDHNGYFELTNYTKEDLKKSELYKDNAKRSQMMSTFDNYEDYLLSLKMKAEINSFKPIYLERISQLSNKSNQFNLTTKRYSLADIENVLNDDDKIKIYGKLEDMFGDNGVISVVIGSIKNKVELHIDLWIMSCRVLKRNMEYAMLDELVKESLQKGIKTIYGYYYPTLKNKMVKDFYDLQGFELINEDEEGNKTYKLEINSNYENKNKVIEVNGK